AQVFLSHGRTPGSSQRAIALVPGRFDDAFHTPFSPAEFMDPAGIIARIGIEQWPSAGQGLLEALFQQSKRLAFVVAGSPVHHQPQGKETAADYHQGKLDPFAPLASRAAGKMG